MSDVALIAAAVTRRSAVTVAAMALVALIEAGRINASFWMTPVTAEVALIAAVAIVASFVTVADIAEVALIDAGVIA